jgi:hypothetical protein
VTNLQFLILLVALLGAVPISVELALRVRWGSIKLMFDRALMHGGSLDTLSRQLKEDSETTKATAEKAVEISRAFKGRLDDHEQRLATIEEHPLMRRLGGGVK